MSDVDNEEHICKLRTYKMAADLLVERIICNKWPDLEAEGKETQKRIIQIYPLFLLVCNFENSSCRYPNLLW